MRARHPDLLDILSDLCDLSRSEKEVFFMEGREELGSRAFSWEILQLDIVKIVIIMGNVYVLFNMK